MESRLEIRYMTHESEDAWWTQQGAKPHPLVVKKEKKFSHHVYKNIQILDDPQRSGVPSIATTVAVAKPPPPPSNTPPPSTSAPPPPTSAPPPSTASSKGTSSATPKVDGVTSKNERLSQLEAHARRVGYTVSTV